MRTSSTASRAKRLVCGLRDHRAHAPIWWTWLQPPPGLTGLSHHCRSRLPILSTTRYVHTRKIVLNAQGQHLWLNRSRRTPRAALHATARFTGAGIDGFQEHHRTPGDRGSSRATSVTRGKRSAAMSTAAVPRGTASSTRWPTSIPTPAMAAPMRRMATCSESMRLQDGRAPGLQPTHAQVAQHVR